MSQVIALVDDDRNILTSVSIALQQEGFVARVFSDGATALKALADNPADLGVFDQRGSREIPENLSVRRDTLRFKTFRRNRFAHCSKTLSQMSKTAAAGVGPCRRIRMR